MILNAKLGLMALDKQLQFEVTMELDEGAEISEIQDRANKAIAVLSTTVNSTMNIAVPPPPLPAVQPKKLSTDPASAGQIKYLKDLLSRCNTTLKQWCQNKGVNENAITGSHCREWIPELQAKTKDSLPF